MKVRDAVAVGEDVEAIGRKPAREKFLVADEDGRASGGVGAVFEIVDAAVQEERGTVCVKEDGRECVVLAVNDELPLWSPKQSFGQRPRST